MEWAGNETAGLISDSKFEVWEGRKGPCEAVNGREQGRGRFDKVHGEPSFASAHAFGTVNRRVFESGGGPAVQTLARIWGPCRIQDPRFMEKASFFFKHALSA